MSVALEMARTALRLTDRDSAVDAMVAEKIIKLAKAGEHNPDPLCERVLFEFGKQRLNGADASEYHLIDLASGLSCGGFKSLAAARQYAREESIIAWDIFHGNTRIERHDPRIDRIS